MDLACCMRIFLLHFANGEGAPDGADGVENTLSPSDGSAATSPKRLRSFRGGKCDPTYCKKKDLLPLGLTSSGGTNYVWRNAFD